MISYIRTRKLISISAAQVLKAVDLCCFYADFGLEWLRLECNQKISSLQAAIFVANNRLHGVDIKRFTGAAVGAAAASGDPVCAACKHNGKGEDSV